MDISTKSKADKDECLTLEKNIYRLLQSSIQQYLKMVESFKSCGKKGSQADACLWIKNTSSGIALTAIYVGDCLIIDTDETIN